MASAPPAGEAPISAPSAVPPAAPSFEDAFAAAAADEGTGEFGAPPAEAPPAEAPPAEAPPAETPPAEAPPAEAPPAEAPPAGTPPAEAPPAAPAPPPAPAPAPAAPATAEEIGRQIADALKQSQTPPAPGAEEAPVAPPPIYSADEQGVIAEYEKNWPDVAQAEALKRRGEYHDLLAYTFQEVHKFYAPYIQQIAAMGNMLHTGELKTLVPDYTPAVETDVLEWIDTQPSYLQAPYKQVMQQGTSEEVADLIGRYRGSSGTAPAPAVPAPAGNAAPVPAPAVPAKTELSNLAKQAAESLAPVSSDRTQVPAGEDPGDFNSAFARYASEASVP